jgi:hypothetical protein
LQVDRDGKLGAHALGNVDRQVIEQAAICVKIVAGVYGSKDPGRDIVARIARASEPS